MLSSNVSLAFTVSRSISLDFSFSSNSCPLNLLKFFDDCAIPIFRSASFYSSCIILLSAFCSMSWMLCRSSLISCSFVLVDGICLGLVFLVTTSNFGGFGYYCWWRASVAVNFSYFSLIEWNWGELITGDFECSRLNDESCFRLDLDLFLPRLCVSSKILLFLI